MSTESPSTASTTVRVVVAGPNGRMGRILTNGLPAEGIEVIGGLRRSDSRLVRDKLLVAADVLVDFTNPDSTVELMVEAMRAGVRPVSGTSGVTDEALEKIDRVARECGVGAVWAPNFRLGGVLVMHLAEIVTRYFEAVEIVEAHHAGKADSPSGTALELARRIRRAHGSDIPDAGVRNEILAGTRGGVEGGVRVHSLRLPGLLSWHEAVFAGEQEILTIRHDDFSREAYTPTVAMAARAVMRPDLVGLVRGLDAVIGLTR